MRETRSLTASSLVVASRSFLSVASGIKDTACSPGVLASPKEEPVKGNPAGPCSDEEVLAPALGEGEVAAAVEAAEGGPEDSPKVSPEDHPED